ncbi:helix-turn-helix transcriptional regulator [Agromyces sp. NPDC056523]|uniref:helix-turn-helix transcriptional regulator n=1 Tax=Agromyces sp. NPDC056523 TaxID=3345850 RepID=UPI00366BFC72
MLDTSVRLLRLLSLLQVRRDWPGAELARRLDVSTRTVRNDIERLRILGYGITSTPGVAGGYRLGAGSATPPLLLDDEEVVATAVSLRAAAAGTITGIEEASVRALAKLEQTLPMRLRGRVDALREATVSAAGGGPTVDGDVLATVAAACRDHERLRFEYTPRDGDGPARDRSFEPSRLVFTGHRWYLLAWDLDREDWRTFRVDRLRPLAPTARRFVPRDPPEGGAAAHVLRSVGARSWPVTARVRFHVAAEALAGALTPPAGLVTPESDEACLLETGSETLHDLAVYLGRLGLPFTVVDPPELAEVIAELAMRFADTARTGATR